MGLAVRVIPTLLARGHQLVKGKQFNSWRSVGHVQQAARVHQSRGVDELIVLDIAATPAGRGPDFAFVEQLTAECYMPITVGGGVRSVADVKRLLACGADKVAIGTAWIQHPSLINECADALGCQAIVVSIDYRPVECPTGERFLGGAAKCGIMPVLIGGMPMSPITLAVQAEKRGAGEILLTSIDREGTMEGYDLDLIRAVSEAVSIPVIAHGGCSGYPDMAEAVKAGASAVAAGALFQFTDATPKEAATYLHQVGIEARV